MADDGIKELAVQAAGAAEDKKADDIQILDVRELTVIADYFLICSGKSITQVKAIARGIDEELSNKGINPKKIAGMQEGRWVLIDYADLIIHIFHEEERKYYELERLWADAEKILRKS